MLHEAVKRLDNRVFDYIEVIAKAERHFNTHARWRVVALVTHIHIVAICTLAPFEVLNNGLAVSLS